MWTWRAVTAVAGGSSAQTSSISRSRLTMPPASIRSTDRIEPARGPPTGTTLPSATTSSGPSTRNLRFTLLPRNDSLLRPDGSDRELKPDLRHQSPQGPARPAPGNQYYAANPCEGSAPACGP